PMLASVLKRDLKNLIQRDASPNFQAQNGLLSLRSWWRSVRSLVTPPQKAAMIPRMRLDEIREPGRHAPPRGQRQIRRQAGSGLCPAIRDLRFGHEFPALS